MMAIAPEDRIRQVTATTKKSTKPAAKPTSSVPTTPVNRNLPTADSVQVEIDAINAATQAGKAVLDPKQYPMKEIVTNTGQKVMVYTSGPLAGQDENGNFPIQATDATAFTSGAGASGGAGGGAGGSGAGGGSGTGGGGGDKPVTYTATDGTVFNDKATYERYQTMLGDKTSLADTRRREGESAYNILYKKFSEYGLGSLVQDVERYVKDGLSEDELTLRLRETPSYQLRFGANKQRIAKGLAALNEAQYIALEDQYQEVMRQYGLPESYWSKDSMGTQKGFEQLIANDVSNTELEDRLMVAQDRVLKADPNILNSLKSFYGDSITNGDILAYTLDPKNAIKDIQRKVTAAEISAAQTGAGFNLGKTPEEIAQYRARAEQLGSLGVTGAQYQQAAPTISEASIRGGQLASIYGEDPYTQQTAEQAILNVPGSAEAMRRTKKLAALETAAFSGSSGRGAIDRERAGQI